MNRLLIAIEERKGIPTSPAYQNMGTKVVSWGTILSMSLYVSIQALSVPWKGAGRTFLGYKL